MVDHDETILFHTIYYYLLFSRYNEKFSRKFESWKEHGIDRLVGNCRVIYGVKHKT